MKSLKRKSMAGGKSGCLFLGDGRRLMTAPPEDTDRDNKNTPDLCVYGPANAAMEGNMRTVTLGRTGLNVSAAGLGTGGGSKLGISKFGEGHAASVVRAAYDEGITFFDTATKYGTQSAVGNGLAGLRRDSYVLSTKFDFVNKADKSLKGTGEFWTALEDSLRALRTDYVDIYHLQGIFYDRYKEICERFMPEMIKAQEQGKIRFLAASEDFPGDMDHKMIAQALEDDFFDVYMLGYNLLNPSAAKTVLPKCEKKGAATLCMYAVRSALSNPEKLRPNIEKILASGKADPRLLKADEDLSFLVSSGAAKTIPEAGYRFCSHTPGLNVILTGTGNIEHLKANIAAINGPKLPDGILERLEALFGNVDCIAGN